MRICVLGKRGAITGWMDGVIAAWRAAGHTIMPIVVRDPRLHPALEKLLFSPRIGAPRAAALVRRIRTFRPDLMVAVSAFATPLSLLERLRRVPGLPPLFGWVGDLFDAHAGEQAPHFDAIGYTDSGLVSLHAKRGLRTEAFYLPHAANAALGADCAPAGPRGADLVFVGNPTPQRLTMLGQLREPVVLYGPGWGTLRDGVHDVHQGRVPLAKLGEVYRAHAAVLNIRNETHVLAGLNQRNFDPFLYGAAVLSDRQPDLERCFDLDLEVAVWNEPAEVDAFAARLRREPAWAATIAERGRKRVLSEHTYAARLAAFARLAGVPTPAVAAR